MVLLLMVQLIRSSKIKIIGGPEPKSYSNRRNRHRRYYLFQPVETIGVEATHRETTRNKWIPIVPRLVIVIVAVIIRQCHLATTTNKMHTLTMRF